MDGEADIIESLNSIGYEGKVLKEEALKECIEGGPKSESFRQLATWLAYEIHVLRGTDEKVGKDSDFNEFMLEMSAFLKELTCPYAEFVEGPLTSRLQSRESRILLLNYLITELMALKMYTKLTPQKEDYIISVDESSTARALQSITKELNLGKPPENIAPKALFDKIGFKLEEVIKKTNPKKLSQSLLKCPKPFTDEQWKKLEKLHKELDQEYDLRRQMLLTRLEVTIQSFQWSEKMKGKDQQIMNKYQKKKALLEQMLRNSKNNTDIAALLSARSDIAIIEKTSSANVRKNTASKIQKHVIGRVPDRGGRAYEHAPPPPEMPSWQQNRSTGGGFGQGGRGGGGNRGAPRGGGGSGGGRGSGNQNRPQQQRGGSQGNNWSQQQQFGGNQNTSGGYNQNSFDQRSQHDDRDRSGNMGGRVQGGWSQKGADNFNQRNDFGSFNTPSFNNQGNLGNPGNYGNQGSYGNQGGGYGNQGNFGSQGSYGSQGNYGNQGSFGSQQNQGHNRNQPYGRSNYSRGGGSRR